MRDSKAPWYLSGVLRFLYGCGAAVRWVAAGWPVWLFLGACGFFVWAVLKFGWLV